MSVRAMVTVACVGVLAACAGNQSADLSQADITRVKDVRSSFGPQFTVTDVGPTGVDPKLLGQQTLPPGMKFDPPDCVRSTQILPEGIKGNMAAVTAEGEGNRFIAIAVETSEEVSMDKPADNCTKVGFAGAGVRGAIEVVDAPRIEGVETLGTRRVLQTAVDGTLRTGQIYTYMAKFGPLLVIVTANPLVIPNQPVTEVNTQRARDLLSASVAEVKG